MIRWLIRLFFPDRKKTAPHKPTPSREAPPRASAPSPEPTASNEPETQEDEDVAFPDAISGVGNLDAADDQLAASEEEVLRTIGERIERGDFAVPALPQTIMTALDLTSNPLAEVSEIVGSIQQDPILSAELLKTANSVMFAGVREAQTHREAVVRLGQRNLRTLILSLAMRGVIFRSKALQSYAVEVWRQTLSMARIAKSIATITGGDAERAFLIGLLHDVGKVPLLDLMSKIATRGVNSRALVGEVFRQHHEAAGARLAEIWNLPDDVVAVAGCHHDFRSNEVNPRGAALASLSHRIDLYLTLGSESKYFELLHSDEMEVLDFSADQRNLILRTCLTDSLESAEAS